MKVVNLGLGRVPVSESWRAGGPRDRGARVWTCGPALSTLKGQAQGTVRSISRLDLGGYTGSSITSRKSLSRGRTSFSLDLY